MELLNNVDRAMGLATAEADAWEVSLAEWSTAEAAPAAGVYAANDKHLRVTGDRLKEANALLGLGAAPIFDRPDPVLDGDGRRDLSDLNAIEAVRVLKVDRPTFAAAKNGEWLAAMAANVATARAAIDTARDKRDAVAALLT